MMHSFWSLKKKDFHICTKVQAHRSREVEISHSDVQAKRCGTVHLHDAAGANQSGTTGSTTCPFPARSRAIAAPDGTIVPAVRDGAERSPCVHVWSGTRSAHITIYQTLSEADVCYPPRVLCIPKSQQFLHFVFRCSKRLYYASRTHTRQVLRQRH